MGTLTAKAGTLGIKIQKVKTAYFAKKVVTGSKASDEKTSYTFTGSSNNTETKAQKEKIAGIIYNKIKPNLDKNNQTTTIDEIIKAFTKKSYKKPDKIEFALTKDTVRFDGLKEANLGEEVYIYIETENMPGREIKMNFNQGGNEKVVAEVEDNIFVTQDGNKTNSFKAVVGEFYNQNTVANAKDFEHFAIAKVKLGSTDEEDNKKYREALDKAKDKKTSFYLSLNAEPEENDYLSVLLEEVVDNRPNLWYYGDGNWFKFKKGKNVINIYHTGEISKLDFKGLKNITYVYHDSNNKQYEICTCDLLEIDERLKGISDDKKTKHTVKTGYDANNIISYSHDSSRKKYTYPDGVIRTYGKFYNPDKKTSYRLVTYKKGTGKKNLVKMPDSLNKKITNKTIIFSFTKTVRRYCGPEHLACFIGALAETGLTLKSGGACEEDGTSYPSISHINGQSVDTSYLNDTNEQKFINAMHKFGFSSQLRGKKKIKFTHTSNGGKLHNNHLHSGVLKPNYKK